MLERFWTEIGWYCFFDEGGAGKKIYLRFTKGSNFFKKSLFLKKKLGYIAGSGWSKLDSGEVFGIFGGVNLSRGDAAVLYEGSKN